MPSKLKVTIVGASGATGISIVNALLKEPEKFEVTVFARPSSIKKPSWIALAERGIQVVAVDLLGPEDGLVSALRGTDVVLSCIFPIGTHQDQINLVKAAKVANVRRFVPGNWGSIIPPGGVLQMRDEKEEILNYIKTLKMPYTIIDVGTWYQVFLPRVPSGKLDYVITAPIELQSEDKGVKLVISDINDIGKQVARIISDDRTLNKQVLAYSESMTHAEALDIVKQSTGEEPQVKIVSEDEARKLLEEAEAVAKADPTNVVNAVKLAIIQYFWSWGIRGDNSVENAKFLGYLDAKDLYDNQAELTSFKSFVDNVVAGKGELLVTDYVNEHKK